MTKNQITTQQWIYSLAIIIGGFFAFYYGIGSYPLFDNNDGLYASIAKNMLHGSSLIIPHLNCLPYIEKPPLLYWLLTLSFKLFGTTAFAARFVTTTCATLLCASIVFFGHKIKQLKIAQLATIIFISSVGIIAIARMVYFDMLLTLCLSATCLAFFYWQQCSSKFALRLVYAFWALAVLAKGLIALILFGGIALVFLCIKKSPWQKYKDAFDLIGVLLFLALTLPWHIAASINQPGFAWDYFIGEQVLRFLNLRIPHDYYNGNIFYYLPRILIYIFPWSLLTFLLFIPTKAENKILADLKLFCWCWLIIPLIFFSISSAKANYYMIISMPALVLLIAHKIYELSAIRNSTLTYIWYATIGLVVNAIFVGAYFLHKEEFPLTTITFSVLLITLGIIFLIGHNTLKQQPVYAIIALAAIIIPSSLLLPIIINFYSERISAAGMVSYIKIANKNPELVLFQDFENYSAAAFYSDQCLPLVTSQSSDLYYGSKFPEANSVLLNAENFLHLSKQKSIYILVANKKIVEFFQTVGKQRFCPIHHSARLTLFANRC